MAIAILPVLLSSVLTIKIKLAQYKARERLEESLLQTLVLKEDQFEWVRNKKEIKTAGRFFDIKSFHREESNFVFRGIFDEEETNLVNSFNSGLQKNKVESVVGVFHLLLSVSLFPNHDVLVSQTCSAIHHPFIAAGKSFPYKDILTPPPQLA